MPGTAHSGGNRQKTRQQHELAGTFRKDRHGDLRTPEPPSGQPEMPADLSEVAQAEWQRMVARLEASQSMWQVDGAVLEQHCKLYAETEEISEQKAEARAGLKILEENIRDVKGDDLVQLFSQIVTLQKLVSKCTDQLRQGRMALRQYLVEFGLTPASRGRVKLPAGEEKVDEFAAFQRAKPAIARVK